MWDKTPPGYISPDIEKEIGEIENRNNNGSLYKDQLAAYYDNIVESGKKEVEIKAEEFINDFLTNPQNEWRVWVEESAKDGYAGADINFSDIEHYVRHGMEELGFKFCNEDGEECIYWPTLNPESREEE